MSQALALNLLGTELLPCSYDPLTGWYRDGCCHTDDQDGGSHLVCARMTMAFLNFQFERGNDLITPRPEMRFRGLKPGDRWCVTARNWAIAFNDGFAAPVVLASTNQKTLEVIPLEWLQQLAIDVPPDLSSLLDPG